MSPKPRKPVEPLILALAAGATYEQAAVKAGCCRKTVVRKMRDPRFRQRVTEARRDMLTAAISKLADALTDAVDTLRRLLTDESPNIRLGASRALLSSLLPLRESEDFAARLEALENRP